MTTSGPGSGRIRAIQPGVLQQARREPGAVPLAYASRTSSPIQPRTTAASFQPRFAALRRYRRCRLSGVVHVGRVPGQQDPLTRRRLNVWQLLDGEKRAGPAVRRAPRSDSTVDSRLTPSPPRHVHAGRDATCPSPTTKRTTGHRQATLLETSPHDRLARQPTHVADEPDPRHRLSSRAPHGRSRRVDPPALTPRPAGRP